MLILLCPDFLIEMSDALLFYFLLVSNYIKNYLYFLLHKYLSKTKKIEHIIPESSVFF